MASSVSATRTASVRIVFGQRHTDEGVEYMIASESVDVLGFTPIRDLAPGEAVYITEDGKLHTRQCATNPSLTPRIFEILLHRSSGLDHRRRVGLQGPSAHGREARREDSS